MGGCVRVGGPGVRKVRTEEYYLQLQRSGGKAVELAVACGVVIGEVLERRRDLRLSHSLLGGGGEVLFVCVLYVWGTWCLEACI